MNQKKLSKKSYNRRISTDDDPDQYQLIFYVFLKVFFFEINGDPKREGEKVVMFA